jgi:hypothetical protein
VSRFAKRLQAGGELRRKLVKLENALSNVEM